MTAGGRTPEELETLLEDALLMRDAEALTPLFEDASVLVAGQRPQLLVPGGTWQCAIPAGDAPGLVTCVVAPGFDAADFRLHDDARP